MQKRSDSIRSLGMTVVAVDKPLRSDIKAMAQKSGVTMVEYLRMKVLEDQEKDPQTVNRRRKRVMLSEEEFDELVLERLNEILETMGLQPLVTAEIESKIKGEG
tara:strand:- start:570 stop:881 length:312 start_codon:yes stop_codon:yes gene_type:complete